MPHFAYSRSLILSVSYAARTSLSLDSMAAARLGAADGGGRASRCCRTLREGGLPADERASSTFADSCFT